MLVASTVDTSSEDWCSMNVMVPSWKKKKKESWRDLAFEQSPVYRLGTQLSTRDMSLGIGEVAHS